MAKEVQEEVQRWTAKRRAALVLSIFKGETSVIEATRKHGLTVAELEAAQKVLPLDKIPKGIIAAFQAPREKRSQVKKVASG